MTPTINNIDPQHTENPTIMKTEMVRWYPKQQHQMAKQPRRIYGRKN